MKNRVAKAPSRQLLARWIRALAATAGAAATLAAALPVRAAYDCASSNPANWPPPARPYFMLVVDSSGSMNQAVGVANSCGYPDSRMGHAKCAVKNTVRAFSEVNF